MRVSLVGPTFPYRGGISHFTALLARAFSASHEVQVINFSRLYPGFLFPGRTQFEEGEPPVPVTSLRLVDSVNPLTWPRAARAVTGFGADLVVFQWWQPFFAPAFRAIGGRAGASGARVVYLCHNVLPHEPSRFDRPLARWGLARAHGFVVQSREDGRTLAGLIPGAHIEFNPMPVFDLFPNRDLDRDEARRRLRVGGRVLLFFGLVRAYKGLPTLLEAFALCADALDATLLIVGEFYEDRAPYDEQIAALGIGARVRVVNEYVPGEDVATYFRAADVVVLPYETATQSAVVQTAFAFETPVIVTAVGGLPDVVADGETGFVVPARDPRALAGAITRFFSEEAGPRMAGAIRAAGGAFAWERCVDAILRAARAPAR